MRQIEHGSGVCERILHATYNQITIFHHSEDG